MHFASWIARGSYRVPLGTTAAAVSAAVVELGVLWGGGVPSLNHSPLHRVRNHPVSPELDVYLRACYGTINGSSYTKQQTIYCF
jgi:hypothetical protein